MRVSSEEEKGLSWKKQMELLAPSGIDTQESTLTEEQG